MERLDPSLLGRGGMQPSQRRGREAHSAECSLLRWAIERLWIGLNHDLVPSWLEKGGEVWIVETHELH